MILDQILDKLCIKYLGKEQEFILEYELNFHSIVCNKFTKSGKSVNVSYACGRCD